jgi:hypothetical protein
MKALGVIKRLIVLAFITALLTLGALMTTSAQPLTHRGGKAMPADDSESKVVTIWLK